MNNSYVICKYKKKLILKKIINIINYNNITLDVITYNTILLKINDIEISMRIHNCSSKITKTLNLKYDVKIIDESKLFTIIKEINI